MDKQDGTIPAISAVLIARNEEKHLERVLPSLIGVVDEILVLDTGSQDATVRVAETFGARIGHFAWVDDFAAARNAALELAQGEYVLSIDADEWIENGEAAAVLLRAFIQQHPRNTVGTVEIISSLGTGLETQEVVDHLERFFHRDSFRFDGAIHEQLTLRLGLKQSAPTGLRLRHTGYAQAANAPNHKARRNLPLLRREVERHPDDEYAWYQLGKAHFTLAEYAEAIAGFKNALGAICFSADAPPQGRFGPVSREVLTGLAVSLAYALVNTGQAAAAAAVLEEHAALRHPGTHWADFHHALGYVYLMLGDIPRSKSAYLESIRLGPAHEDVRGTGSFSSAYHLGLLAEAEQNLPAALEWYTASIKGKADYLPALSRCLDLAVEQSAVFPRELLEHADMETFSSLYLKRLRHAMEIDDTPAASRLIQAAALSPTLRALCKVSMLRAPHPVA